MALWSPPRTPRARRLLVALVALVVPLAGCSSSTTARPGASGTASTSAPAFPVTLTDDDGIQVTMPSAPHRIITFAPSNTEILFALGLGSRVVGVSGKFDNYPPQATSIEQVG